MSDDLAALDGTVKALMGRAAREALTEYRASQEEGWTFRDEHIQNAVDLIFAAALRASGERANG